MNVFVLLCGKLYLLFQKAGERVKADSYKKRFDKCGERVVIAPNCIMIPEHIRVGNNVSIGYGCSLMASIAYINIGNNVMLSPGVVIRGGGHRYDLLGKNMIDIKDNEKLPENDQDVYIEDDVWIGQNAIILKGVTVGRGSIIGAGSVVAKSVPPYTIHVGVHDVLEKPRFNSEQIKKHEAILYKTKTNREKSGE